MTFYVLDNLIKLCDMIYLSKGFSQQIVEPSKEVAYQLLESGRQNQPTRKLGLDMLRQLSLHQDYVVLLVQDGYYLEALQYVRKFKVRPLLQLPFLSSEKQCLLILHFQS